MSGSDGRYISVVSGPIALNAASKAVSAKVPGRSMDFLRRAECVSMSWRPVHAMTVCQNRRLIELSGVRTVAMQIGAKRVDPGFGAAHVRANALYHPPEPA